MNARELGARIADRVPDVIVARDEVALTVEPAELLPVLAWLRDEDELRFDSLSSLTPTDWPSRTPRYWLSYELYSMVHRHRVRVRVGVAGDDPRVPSVTSMFPTADWHEREAWDLFGIVFDGHPRLTRILLPEDWEGHPLRKTEDLGGVNTAYKGAFIPPVDRRTTG